MNNHIASYGWCIICDRHFKDMSDASINKIEFIIDDNTSDISICRDCHDIIIDYCDRKYCNQVEGCGECFQKNLIEFKRIIKIVNMP